MVSASHTTVHTGHVHGGSDKSNPYLAAAGAVGLSRWLLRFDGQASVHEGYAAALRPATGVSPTRRC